MSCGERDPEGQELVARIQKRHRQKRGLERIVFEAMGGASVCWENTNSTGEFQSVRAKELGDAAVAEIWQLFEMQAEMEKADV